MKKQILLAALTAFAVGLSGCGKEGGKNNPGPTITGGGNGGSEQSKLTEAEVQSVIDNIADNVIIKVYTDLSNKTADLHAAIVKLRTNRTQANLEAAQNAWKAARVPWESSEGFLFGPVDSLAVDPHIDSWPLSKTDLDRIMRDNPRITADTVRGLGTDVQGFHTVEYLLFGEGISSNTKSINDLTDAQVSYLVASSEVLHEQTEKLRLAWASHHDPEDGSSPSYISLVKKPGASNPFFRNQIAVLQQFISGIEGIANEVGTGKIAGPFGADVSSADPSIVESQFSWNSLADFQDNIRSIQYIYTGDYAGHQGPGLDVIVAKLDPQLNEKVLAQIQEGIDAIGAIAGSEKISFSQAISSSGARARIQKAIDAMAGLERTLNTEVLPLAQ